MLFIVFLSSHIKPALEAFTMLLRIPGRQWTQFDTLYAIYIVSMYRMSNVISESNRMSYLRVIEALFITSIKTHRKYYYYITL